MKQSAIRWGLTSGALTLSSGIAGWFAHGTLAGCFVILVLSAFGAFAGMAAIDIGEGS